MPPDIDKVKIIAMGDWSPPAVSIAWTANRRRLVPEVEAAIDLAWAAALARPGVHLFDGPMCRLESWTADDQHLGLVLSKSSYKTFLGTNMAHPEFADAFGPDVMANPVGVSPALCTADNWLLLGHRTLSVAYYPGRIHPFSGSLEPGDTDPFSAVKRELQEELSLKPEDVADIRCIGMAEDPQLRQPELIFAVRSILTRGEIEAGLDEVEHEAVYALSADPSVIKKAVEAETRLTPIAVAAMTLWNRHRISSPF